MPEQHPINGPAGDVSSISGDETIIRRLPARPDTTKRRPNGELTATSFAIQPKPGESFPSWSRKRITAPEHLLHLAERQGYDITGWKVCQLAVQVVRGLGLDVVADPTDEDPGHCVIKPTTRRAFSKSVWSALAKQTRVLFSKTHDR